MLFSARLKVCSHTRSFLNSKFGMRLVHLKIEKCRSERARPMDGVDLVLTEWTPHRKSTHKMKNRSWFGGSQCFLLHLYSACGAPMPCAAGSSTTAMVGTSPRMLGWKRKVDFRAFQRTYIFFKFKFIGIGWEFQKLWASGNVSSPTGQNYQDRKKSWWFW